MDTVVETPIHPEGHVTHSPPYRPHNKSTDSNVNKFPAQPLSTQIEPACRYTYREIKPTQKFDLQLGYAVLILHFYLTGLFM